MSARRCGSSKQRLRRKRLRPIWGIAQRSSACTHGPVTNPGAARVIRAGDQRTGRRADNPLTVIVKVPFDFRRNGALEPSSSSSTVCPGAKV